VQQTNFAQGDKVGAEPEVLTAAGQV